MSAIHQPQLATGPSLRFLLPLYPGFQLLDAAGPLDILNFLSSPPHRIPITLTICAETLDPVPTKLSDLPLSDKWRYDSDAATGGIVNGRFTQKMSVDMTFEDVLSGKGEWDVMLIPGGVGSRVLRYPISTSEAGEGDVKGELAVQPLIDLIKSLAPKLKVGIMTVCTGSDILGYTSLLNKRRATTNMSRFADVAGRHRDVNWVKGARWVKSPVEEGKDGRGKENGEGLEIWTSAGVSAGMDLMLAFVAEKFGGRDVAWDLARRGECE